MSGYAVAHLDEVTTLPSDDPSVPDWKPLRHELGVTAFGLGAWVGAEAGAQVIEEHDELPEEDGDDPAGHEEVYLVLRGSAEFTVGGAVVDAPAGTLLRVDPDVRRSATAREAGTVVLAVGVPLGRAFTPSPWELRELARYEAA